MNEPETRTCACGQPEKHENGSVNCRRCTYPGCYNYDGHELECAHQGLWGEFIAEASAPKGKTA